MFELIAPFYRFLFRPSIGVICFFALPFSRTLRALLKSWRRWPDELLSLSQKAACMEAPTRVWIHTPSIGEFESMRWMVDQLLQDQRKSIVLTYSSPSMKYYFGQNPSLTTHPRFGKLFFPLDSYHRLMRLRRVARPTHFILLQYDFWPNLMQAIMADDPIGYRTLLNFTPPHLGNDLAGNLIQDFQNSYVHLILDRFSLIHRCEETATFPFAFPDMGLTFVSPHTRWANLTDEHSKPSALFQVVAGNVHKSDQPFLSAIFKFSPPTHYQLLWVPHTITDENISVIRKRLERLCKAHEIEFRFADTVEKVSCDQRPGVILFTSFGLLKKLYTRAGFAYVGGGYEPKGIHNLIEPLSWGCPVISGPRYHRQSIALWAKEQGFLATAEGSVESYEPLLKNMISKKDKYKILQMRILQARDTMREGCLKIPSRLHEFE